MTLTLINDQFLNGFVKRWKDQKDDRPLTKVFTSGKELELKTFAEKVFFGKNWAKTSVDLLLKKLIPLAWQNVRKAMAVRDQFARWNFGKFWTCGGAHLQSADMKVFCISIQVRTIGTETHVGLTAVDMALQHLRLRFRTKLERKRAFHDCLFRAFQSTIFAWKSTSVCQSYCHSLDGATLFSKIV